jgi:hypothetical protein
MQRSLGPHLWHLTTYCLAHPTPAQASALEMQQQHHVSQEGRWRSVAPPSPTSSATPPPPGTSMSIYLQEQFPRMGQVQVGGWVGGALGLATQVSKALCTGLWSSAHDEHLSLWLAGCLLQASHWRWPCCPCSPVGQLEVTPR